MFEVIDKKTGVIRTVYSVQENNRGDAFLFHDASTNNVWYWDYHVNNYDPYVKPKANMTKEYYVVAVIVHYENGDDRYRYINLVWSSKEDADKCIIDYDAAYRTESGELISGVLDIKFDQTVYTLQQLRSFLTVKEYEELIATGKTGDGVM